VWLFESAIDTHWLSTWVCTHLPDRDEKFKKLGLVYNHGSQKINLKNQHLTLILCWFFMKTAGSLTFLK
jgi:hypothetical protein